MKQKINRPPVRFPQIFLLGLIFVFGLMLIINTGIYAAEIQWAKSAIEGFATAKQSGKMLMIDFYTEW